MKKYRDYYRRAAVQAPINLWKDLNTQRRVIVSLAAIATSLAVFGLVRMVTEPRMALLYSGLEPSAAGEVVGALTAAGAHHEVRGSAIFVESGHRDSLRLTLASDGLPSVGNKGYELLEGLSGFGTTSQMFDAAYWRAKEGELARTIVSGRGISQARVHIANLQGGAFAARVRPTASVSLTATGGEISAGQAEAVRYLIASAVAGLAAEDVAVIDSTGALIDGTPRGTAPSAGQSRAEDLRQKVLRLVEARVGRGNAVVEVSVETEMQSESIFERRLDPNGRVEISSDIEEKTLASNGSGGTVTVASNLPDGDAAGASSQAEETSETRERINYEVSQTEREIVRAAGTISRISVAVLVGGLLDAGGAFTPRPQEELEVLRDLVESAVAFDAERGDVIALRSLELTPDNVSGTASTASLFANMALDVMTLIQAGVLALVALLLGLFVVRPILTKPAPLLASNSAPQDTPLALSSQEESPENRKSVTAFSNNEIDVGNGKSLDVIDMRPMPDESSMSMLSSDNPLYRLRGLTDSRRTEAVEILRAWLEEKEGAA